MSFVFAKIQSGSILARLSSRVPFGLSSRRRRAEGSLWTTRRAALLIAALLIAALGSPCKAADRAPPNVLLIILDDQNAFAGRTDLAPEPVTPNLDRFAKGGVTFANAQCAAPICNPSRTALLSGLRPSTTGIYDNDQDDIPDGHMLTRAPSLPRYFQEHGYKVAGGGKVFGSATGSLVKKNRLWEETFALSRAEGKHGPLPPKESIPLNGIGKHDWGAFPESREQMADWQLAGWAAKFLTTKQPKPFFLACGIVRPHTPWYVPQEYFDRYPPERITIHDLAADESAGLPAVARDRPAKTELQLAKRRNELVAAYLASSRYADDCVGRILDGLAGGPYRDNTIVVICGDNGYQFGEKNTWSKGRLWEGSTHIPLVIVGPDIAKDKTSARPVSLVDLYPTLLELAGLPPRSNLDGQSIVPLLKDPSAAWDRPALTTAGCDNHALRSERWRYIRYSDGSEELYDHDHDPLERNNVAGDPQFAAVKASLKAWLPKTNEPRTPSAKGGKGGDD